MTVNGKVLLAAEAWNGLFAFHIKFAMAEACGGQMECFLKKLNGMHGLAGWCSLLVPLRQAECQSICSEGLDALWHQVNNTWREEHCLPQRLFSAASLHSARTTEKVEALISQGQSLPGKPVQPAETSA